jgi:hypothetical protein
MDIAKIIVGAVVAVIGWLIAHHFSSKRDVRNSQRAIRMAALAEAYKAIVRAGIDGVMLQRDKGGEIINGAKAVEDAISLIHLYGTQEQSDLASKYVQQVAKFGKGEGTELVNALRRDIRENLGGCDIEGTPSYLRVNFKDRQPNKNSQQDGA